MSPQELFEYIARVTWHTIANAHARRIQYGEDAITSVNLVALDSFPSRQVFVQDTRADESRKGCDFELWVGDNFKGWRRYAVQAKKIQASTSKYRKLDHRIGKSGKLQIDILRAYSSANGALPLYCLYNYSKGLCNWSCGMPEDREQLGCSVVPIQVIDFAIANSNFRNFSTIHSLPYALPWRCLIDCRCQSKFPSLLFDFLFGTNNFYERLPRSLENLRVGIEDNRQENSSELFNSNFDFRPGWIAVIDTADEFV
jgi:hypothetical protein